MTVCLDKKKMSLAKTQRPSRPIPVSTARALIVRNHLWHLDLGPHSPPVGCLGERTSRRKACRSKALWPVGDNLGLMPYSASSRPQCCQRTVSSPPAQTFPRSHARQGPCASPLPCRSSRQFFDRAAKSVTRSAIRPDRNAPARIRQPLVRRRSN